METKTRFDLTLAIENWRAELAAQSDLTTEVRRELETHLCDSISELQQCGLNEEEAFWVARKRVGKPGQLEEEFVKADPASIWRERVFWMTLAVLLVWLWSTGSAIIAAIVSNAARHLLLYEIPRWEAANYSLVEFGSDALNISIRVLPICWLAFFVAKGRLNAGSRWIVYFRSRSRLAVYALIWSLTNAGLTILSYWHAPIPTVAPGQAIADKTAMFVSYPILPNLVYSISLPVAFIVLLVWLMPAHFQVRPKAA
ncbi:MAG TPA: permease prefix domain 1-containing protein [Verrucomicrobiae bacterium]|jgi:hypothetical protein|nr:permease prefix domain 1-containing protein [Verrucomicrobiae bacterium]